MEAKSEIATRVSAQSAFAHGELIQIVQEPQRVNDQFVTLACLNRNDAADAIRATHERDLSASLQTINLAKERLQQGDRRGFTTALTSLRRNESVLREALAQSRVLRGEQLPDETAYLNGLEQVEAAAAQLRAQTKIWVAIAQTDLPVSLYDGLTTLIMTSLSEKGVHAKLASENECGQSPHDLRLWVTPETKCEWGRLGHSCALKLSSRLSACTNPDAPLARGDLGGTLRAHHRQDVQVALSRTLGAAEKSVPDQLYELLRPEIPMDAATKAAK